MRLTEATDSIETDVGSTMDATGLTMSPLATVLVVVGGILVLWIVVGYLWNNKYRLKRIKNDIPTATFNHILKRVFRFLFKEDKVQIEKIKVPLLRKLLVWRNFYFATIIASIVLPLLHMSPLIPLVALFIVAATRTSSVFRQRHGILMRMFDVASVGLSYPRDAPTNPWSWVNIKKWEDMTTPGETIVKFPAKFKSGEMKNRESFENHFSTTVTDGNSWIFTWKSADSVVLLSPVTHIPEMAPYPGSENSDWDKIPIGVGSSGEVIWDLGVAPHALISGTTGAGKSVLQRNIIFHCIQHPDRWRFLGIDVKMVELPPYLPYDPVVMSVATSVEDGTEIIRYANEEMQNRYKLMQEMKVNNFRKLPDMPYAIMVMIDESYAFLATTGNKTDEGKAKDALKGEASAAIGDIARLGRAAGIHLVMATQRPDAVVIYGELKQNLAARFSAGRADSIASQMTLDNDQATRLPSIKGRGYLQINGEGNQFQGYYADETWIDDWLASKEAQDSDGAIENNGDTVNLEKAPAKKAKKQKSGSFFSKMKGKPKKAKESPVEDDVISLEKEDVFIDPLDDIPNETMSSEELSELANGFNEVDEADYNGNFFGEDVNQPELPDIQEGIPDSMELPSMDPNLDAIFDEKDSDGNYASIFNNNVEPELELDNNNSIFGTFDDDLPVMPKKAESKVQSQKIPKAESKVQSQKIPKVEIAKDSSEDPFADPFEDPFAIELDPFAMPDEMPKIKVKPLVRTEATSAKTMPSLPKRPTRPTL